MPGEQQQARDTDKFVVGELGAVLTHQHAEDVLAGVPARALHQRMHIRATLHLQVDALGNRNGQIQLARTASLEVVAVVVGHTEQLTDHQRRDRQCEAVHQIDRRTGTFHRVEVLRRRSR